MIDQASGQKDIDQNSHLYHKGWLIRHSAMASLYSEFSLPSDFPVDAGSADSFQDGQAHFPAFVNIR